MRLPSLVLAASDAAAGRLTPALAAAGFAVTRLTPAEALPARVLEIAPRVLILEDPSGDPLLPEKFWSEQEMDAHLPILLLRPPGATPIPRPELDEPLEEVSVAADPGEVTARVSGLIRERLLRVFRHGFHELSQPLTVARALSRKALMLSSPTDSADATLRELDRQMDRLFRIAESLQRKRGE